MRPFAGKSWPLLFSARSTTQLMVPPRILAQTFFPSQDDSERGLSERIPARTFSSSQDDSDWDPSARTRFLRAGNRDQDRGQLERPRHCQADGRSPLQRPRRYRFFQLPLHAFFRRTERVIKILDILHASNVWNKSTVHALEQLGVYFNAYTVSEVIRNCTSVDMALKYYHWLKVRNAFKPDSYVYGTLIYKLGKAGRFAEMEAVSASCEAEGAANVATFTSIISAYMKVKNINRALSAWQRMEKFRIKPSQVTYTTMIDLYAEMGMYKEAGDFYLKILEEKMYPDVRTCTILMKHLVKAGKLDAAREIFDLIVSVKVKPNFVTYATMMICLTKAGDVDGVLELVRHFKYYGHRPRPLGKSLRSYFKYVLNEGRVEEAERVMSEVWPESSEKDRQKMVLEIQTECERGENCGGAYDVMTDFTDSDSDSEETESRFQPPKELMTTWNMSAFAKSFVSWGPVEVEILEKEKVNWDGPLVSETLKRMKSRNVALKFFNWVGKQPGFSHDSFCYSRMIQLLLTAGDFEKVIQLMEEAHERHVVLPMNTYNNALKYSGLRRADEAALKVFKLLERTGLKPDQKTYVRLIHALHLCKRHKEAVAAFSKMLKAGFHPDAQTYSFLICDLIALGNSKSANKVYKRMRASNLEPNGQVYKAYISSYFQDGKVDKAEKIFQQIRESGVEPSKEIYEVMIEGLSEAGKDKAAAELELEKNELMPNNAILRKRQLDRFRSFHTLFMENMTNTDETLAVAIA